MRHTLKGFTMIELSLSMAVIGVLSLAIVMIIANAVSSYHKGVTMNQLNTTGMDLVEDMRVSIEASPARSVADECASLYSGGNSDCTNDHAMSFVAQVQTGNVQANTNGDVPLYGLFCTGKYTYLWNSGYVLNDNDDANDLQLKYTYTASNGASETKTMSGGRLIKYKDEGRATCKKTAGYDVAARATNNTYSGGTYTVSSKALEQYVSDHGTLINISSLMVLDDEPVDILETNSNLALYDLSIQQPASVDGLNSMFYSASFILGTLRGGVDITVSGDFCQAPNDYDADFDYCAVNKFNFAAQAIGG